jgi:RecJ-like exonuclease
MIFELETVVCPTCGRQMMKKDKCSMFPLMNGQEKQMREKGVVYKSQSMVENEYICEVCEGEGKAVFTCFICNTLKKSDKIQLKIGDPPEFLCTDCYSSITADLWDRAVQALKEIHKYDYV